MKPMAVLAAGLAALNLLTGCTPTVKTTASNTPATLETGTWYHSTAIDGAGEVDVAARTEPIRVLLTQQADGPAFIIDGPTNGYTVPVTIDAGRVTPDHSRHAGVTLVACGAASSACIVDRWVGTWATKPFTVSFTRERLQINEGDARITLSK